MSSAQDEFNQLLSNNRDKTTSHPEDREPVLPDEEPSSRYPHRHTTHDSSDEDSNEETGNMVSSRTGNYHIPNTVFEANTGPKGVIADAQAFERARKKSFRRTLLSVAGLDSHVGSGKPDPALNAPAEGSSSEDDEERFMRKWRASRMHELQNRGMRRPSPRGRVYGRVEDVDAEGYLDAVEKVSSETVVVVCIYDPESDESAVVEECLATVARRQQGTRFVKLHHEIAEMDNIQAPALLAYRGGDVFATIVDILRNIPKGRSCSADSLEDLLKLNRVL